MRDWNGVILLNPKDPSEAFSISVKTGTVVRVDLATGNIAKVGNSNADSIVDDELIWALPLIQKTQPRLLRYPIILGSSLGLIWEQELFTRVGNSKADDSVVEWEVR